MLPIYCLYNHTQSIVPYPLRSLPLLCLMELDLVLLLRLAWMVPIVPIVLALLPFPFLGFFRQLVKELAVRGKLKGSTRFTVPQRYFLHFYIMAVILTTCLLISTWAYAYAKMTPLSSEPRSYSTITSHLIGGSNTFSLKVWKTVFLLLLLEIQALRRLHETLNVFHYGPSARLHIMGYFTGFFFYVVAPVSLASPCIIEVENFLRAQIAEFIVKGRDKMSDLRIDPPGLVNPLLSLGWCQWVGAAIFFLGWVHQFRCHSILVIYVGILVASGGYDITVWLLLIFVATNLSFAAADAHRWYKQKFEDYPRTRRAIIPFIY